MRLKVLLAASGLLAGSAAFTGAWANVTNVDTGANYSDLATAIADAATLAGHTLRIDASFTEPAPPVVVSKDITITGSTGDEVVVSNFVIPTGVATTFTSFTIDGNNALGNLVDADAGIIALNNITVLNSVNNGVRSRFQATVTATGVVSQGHAGNGFVSQGGVLNLFGIQSLDNGGFGVFRAGQDPVAPSDGSITVTNGTLSGNGVAGVGSVRAQSHDITLSGVDITGGGAGIIAYNGVPLQLSFSDGEISGTAGAGLNIGFDINAGGQPQFEVDGALITGNAGGGVQVFSQGATVAVANSTITANGVPGSAVGDGVQILGADNDIVLSNTTVSNNERWQILAEGPGQGFHLTLQEGSQVTGTNGNGAITSVSTGSAARPVNTIVIDDSTVGPNPGPGIFTFQPSGPYDITLQNGAVIEDTFRGMWLANGESTNMNGTTIVVDGSTIRNSANVGIAIEGQGDPAVPALVDTTVRNGSLVENGGIHNIMYFQAIGDVLVQDSTLSGSSAAHITFEGGAPVATAGTITVVGSDLLGNGGAAIQSNKPDTVITVDNSTISGAGSAGISLFPQGDNDGARQRIELKNDALITGAGAHGIQVTTPEATVSIIDSAVSGSGFNGVQFSSNGGEVLLNRATIQGNGVIEDPNPFVRGGINSDQPFAMVTVLDDSLIDANPGFGVAVFGPSSMVEIADSQISGAAIAAGLSLRANDLDVLVERAVFSGNNGNGAICFASEADGGFLDVFDSEITGNANGGIGVVDLARLNTITIDNTLIAGNGTGVRTNGTVVGPTIINIQNGARIENNGDTGIRLFDIADGNSLSIFDSFIRNNGQRGILVNGNVENPGQLAQNIAVQISNTEISGNSNRGAEFDVAGGGITVASDSQISNNSGFGLLAINRGPNQLQTSVFQSTFEGNNRAIAVRADPTAGDGGHVVNISGSTFTGNTNCAIQISAFNGGSLNSVNIVDCDIANPVNDGMGIEFNGNNGASSSDRPFVSIGDVRITGTGDGTTLREGIRLRNTTNFTIDLFGVDILNPTDAGIRPRGNLSGTQVAMTQVVVDVNGAERNGVRGIGMGHLGDNAEGGTFEVRESTILRGRKALELGTTGGNAHIGGAFDFQYCIFADWTESGLSDTTGANTVVSDFNVYADPELASGQPSTVGIALGAGDIEQAGLGQLFCSTVQGDPLYLHIADNGVAFDIDGAGNNAGARPASCTDARVDEWMLY